MTNSSKFSKEIKDAQKALESWPNWLRVGGQFHATQHTEVNDWQSIETAPQDGTEIFGAKRLQTGKWIMHTIKFLRGKWRVTWDHVEIEPTHWRPLPPPQTPDDI